MCWSSGASTVLATIGITTTIYSVYKKEPLPLCFALGYFALMEALQAFTYTVINECDNPANQIATLLSYLHIAIQPFFANAVYLYFIDEKVRDKIAYFVYFACFCCSIIMIIQLYPFDWAGSCNPSRPLCGQILCSVFGNWHIAWLVPTNGIGNSLVDGHMLFGTHGFIVYDMIVFVIPILYGSWKMVIYHFLLGSTLAKLTTDNLNEWPAVWCLFSIGLLLIVVKTPIRNLLYVKKWFWWKLIK
ncbi:MAG: DUF5765 domain-containing protein [Candidatus Tisiphia sp.]